MGEFYYAQMKVGPMTREAWAQAAGIVDVDEEVWEIGDGQILVELTDDQASYGLSQFEDLRAKLIELGIPYTGSDDGKYDIGGQRVWWAPGMDVEFEVQNHASDGPYLPEHAWDRILEAHAAPIELVAVAIVEAVKRHFGKGIVPQPHPTEAAFEARWPEND